MPHYGNFRSGLSGYIIAVARVFIGLGSNVGDRAAYLEQARDALAHLPGFILHACSGIDETDPVEYLDQPRFLNQVVEGETNLPPGDFLAKLLDIEHKLGRKREIPKGPRAIDLDLLLYGNIVYRDDFLSLPHPGIKRRLFILKQLLELDDTLADPKTGEKYREVYRNAQNRKHS